MATFVDLGVWTFAQTEARPDNVGCFANMTCSVWDAFIGE